MRVLKFLQEQDAQLTVGELVQKIKADQAKAELKDQDKINSYRTKYKESYLKKIDEDSIFGKTINIYYIMRLEGTGKNTDWKTFYHVSGNKISFSSQNINFRGLDPQRVDDSFTAEKLDSMQVITKDEYLKYHEQYFQIQESLNKIINKDLTV
jgi:hypothetical protein